MRPGGILYEDPEPPGRTRFPRLRHECRPTGTGRAIVQPTNVVSFQPNRRQALMGPRDAVCAGWRFVGPARFASSESSPV